MANVKSIGGNPIVIGLDGLSEDAISNLIDYRPIKDEGTGRYTNASLALWLASLRSHKVYGVSIPKGSATACTKTRNNAGIAVPTPGYVGQPAIDPYADERGAFFYCEVNGGVDADGSPYVTDIRGIDSSFSRDGSNGDVWIMTPTLYWAYDESDSSACELVVSDSLIPGLNPQPQAYLPDGSLRPYMLYAKYIGSNDGSGMMASVSGAKPWNRNVSHNALITDCKNATTGYSGKSIADDWYLKAMFLLKYATKNSQSVFCGANNYNYQYAPAVAETGVTRVILTNAQAANLMVGSAMMLGTHTAGSSDRSQATCYDVFDGLRILSITDYDAVNKAINFDTSDTFDTATTYLLSTSPWWAGSLDTVEGDGTLTEAGRLNGHEPCKIQGIETMMGLFELLGDVILNGDATLGWEACVNYDSRNEATSVTANYTHTGNYLEAGSSAAHHYPLYPSNAGGLLLGQGTGASQSTGMADSQYTSALGTGTREWYGLGSLVHGGIAGLWYVSGNSALAHGGWIIGSRLSGTGRSRAAA